MKKLFRILLLFFFPVALLAISEAQFKPFTAGDYGKIYRVHTKVEIPTHSKNHMAWHYFDHYYNYHANTGAALPEFQERFENEYKGFPLLFENNKPIWIYGHGDAHDFISLNAYGRARQVRFHPNGSVKEALLLEDQVIDQVPVAGLRTCKKLTYSSNHECNVEFDEDAKITRAIVSETYRPSLGGIFLAGEVFERPGWQEQAEL